MENTNNIMLMLNKIENSLNELSRRVSALEGRQNIAQPMRVNPVPNTSPYNIRPLPMFKPNFKPNEMYVLHGNNPRSPQYIINKGIEQLKELNAITLDYFIRCRKQGYITDVNNGPNGDSVFDKIEAIELTLLQGLNNLQHNYSQHNYNIELNNINISKEVERLHDKYCYSNIPYVQEPTQFVMEKLNAIKHDINVLLSNHITIQDIKTVNNSNVNYTPISSSITQENLSDIQEWVNNTGRTFQQPPMYNKSSNYKTHSDRPINPIIDNIIDALTNRHKVNLTASEKYILNKLKSLDSIPDDIYNHVTSLHLHVMQYKCMPEVFMSLLTSICDMMYARGYMDDECKLGETVNDKPKEVSMSEKIEFIKHFYTKDTFIRISKSYQDVLDWLAQQKNLSNNISNKINMIYIKIKASRDKHLGYVTVVHEALNELSDLLDNILANNKNSVENIEWVDQNSNVKKPTIDKSKPIVQKPKRQQVRKR